MHIPAGATTKLKSLGGDILAPGRFTMMRGPWMASPEYSNDTDLIAVHTEKTGPAAHSWPQWDWDGLLVKTRGGGPGRDPLETPDHDPGGPTHAPPPAGGRGPNLKGNLDRKRERRFEGGDTVLQ